ncbi:MAG: ATP-binding protein [Rhizobiales bacterium]|nr:ATP-binding protein [Hyphomicrobiales bacterium]
MTRKRAAEAVVPTPIDQTHAEDDEFLASVVEALPADSQRVIAELKRIKKVYIRCGRDIALKNKLHHFLELILANRGERRDDGRIFLVTGESGAGKSRIVEQLISEIPALQPQVRSYGTLRPIVTVSLTGPCTLGVLGRMVLEQAGYPILQSPDPSELWRTLPDRLHHKKVLIIHIDETHHMLKETEADRDRKALAKALKGVMNHAAWPISIIMSGLPRTTEIARLDEQFERRGFFENLPDIDIDHERKLVLNILRDMAEAAGIDATSVLATDIPDRIAHAAKYRYGRTTQVVLATLQIAMKENAKALHRNHFANAYILHSSAQGRDDMNPFLVDEWRLLPPGSFIIEGDKLP